ncbi:MAG TPA: hypothetical protein VKT81_23720 [Bryobacteraceae bacterium]|nr:hypothetical protein [Bryobacteraceae bacterium]
MNYILAAAALAIGLAWLAPAQSREHSEASFTLRLPAPPSVVFPLFGPIRESEWSPDWSPTVLYPADRIQKAGAVFTTLQHEQKSIWILTTYDAAALRIGYVIVTPERTAAQLDISLRALADRETEVTVIHRLTSLGEASDDRVKRFAREFPQEREHWQQAISRRVRELTEY